MIATLVTTTPNDHGYTNSGFWSTRILATVIKRQYGVVYASRTSYYVLFKKASFSFHLPGKKYEKADAEVVADWGKDHYERLKEAFSDPDTVILCEDEMATHPGDDHPEGLDTPGYVSGCD